MPISSSPVTWIPCGLVLAGLASVGFGCAKSTRVAPPSSEAPVTSPGDDDEGSQVANEPDAGNTTIVAATDAGGVADVVNACATSTVTAARTPMPIDIIWVVDNSPSMQPAVTAVQAGLNDFANLVGTKGLDYKVLMLSLRGVAPFSSGGKMRYPVCIPAPLGGANCGNGARFFHAAMDVKSTQPLEQLLGTLDQTDGYRNGQDRGSEPWAAELRPGATKSFVVVTDDESRLSATLFETFAGGPNPNNASLTLPPGLLDPSRGGMFDGYTFSAIYGWGSPTDPSQRCTYPGGDVPPASGATYTTLVTKTAGARAQICSGSSAWSQFFQDVATAVEHTSRTACDIAIPAPSGNQTLDPNAVNITLAVGGSTSTVPRVASVNDCGSGAGWYYDDAKAPTRVLLCPTSCDASQATASDSGSPEIDLVFGCATVIR